MNELLKNIINFLEADCLKNTNNTKPKFIGINGIQGSGIDSYYIVFQCRFFFNKKGKVQLVLNFVKLSNLNHTTLI